MRDVKRFRIFVTAVLCLFVSGCGIAAKMRTHPDMPLVSEKADADAKRFQPKPGKASVYVIREYTFTGQNTLCRISLDEIDQGRLAPGTFILFSVSPGKHEVSFKGKMDRGKEKIYAVKGGIYYIEIRPRSGIVTVPGKILRIDQKRGKQLIAAGKRAGISAAAGNNPVK